MHRPGEARPRGLLLLGVLGLLSSCGPTVAADEPGLEAPNEASIIELDQPRPGPTTTELTEPFVPQIPETRPSRNEGPRHVIVDCTRQLLHLYQGQELRASYAISTSASGLGSAAGSNRTPLGRHRVAEKFGEGASLGEVFSARRSTGRIARILTDDTDVPEDLVLTRILWLEGLEPGVNRGPGVDSHDRYIYIHGTNEEGLIGRPASHGCVRMRNRDVVELFAWLPVGAEVELRR